MLSPHQSPPVWSVIALEGSQIELRTLGGLCTLSLSFMWSEYWLIPTNCFGLTYYMRMYLFIIITPMCFHPLDLAYWTIMPLEGAQVRWCTIERHCLLSTITCWLTINVFWGHTMWYSYTYINHIHLICFHICHGVCWSVIALGGAQIKRCTLERHCVMKVSQTFIK